jgi:mono/diheme cytochrome c family protein
MSTAAFVAFFVIVGLLTVFVAMRGGPYEQRPLFNMQSRGGRRALALFVGLLVVLFAVAIPLAIGIEGTKQAEAGPAGIELNAAETRGRQIFYGQCGQCHTLKAAAAVGTVGPNLDEMRPPGGLVLDAIKNGRARGQGQMPALLVTGQEARDVAAFITKTAGR